MSFPRLQFGWQACHPQPAATSSRNVLMISANHCGLPALSVGSAPGSLSEHIESFLPNCKLAPTPRLVKALDRFAAHILAALTNLRARVQTPSARTGMSQTVRVPNVSKRAEAAWCHALLPCKPNPLTQNNDRTYTRTKLGRTPDAACFPAVCLPWATSDGVFSPDHLSALSIWEICGPVALAQGPMSLIVGSGPPRSSSQDR